MSKFNSLLTELQIPENISTIDKLNKWLLENYKIKFIQVVEDEGFLHFGWFNKDTKTSKYVVSEYNKLTKEIYEQCLVDLNNWSKDEYTDCPLIVGKPGKLWKKSCK